MSLEASDLHGNERSTVECGNRPGDATITWRWTRSDSTWMALIYPLMSSWYQNPLTMDYLEDNWKRGSGRRTRFWEAMAQYAVWGAFVGTFLVLDWKRALLYIGGPTAVSLWMVMFFNYVQHVNCDAESKWNHSRTFVGPVRHARLAHLQLRRARRAALHLRQERRRGSHLAAFF